MSEPVIVALIVSCPPTLAMLVSLWKLSQIAKAIYEVHIQLDGRLDEWIQLVKSSSYADGMKDGKQNER